VATEGRGRSDECMTRLPRGDAARPLRQFHEILLLTMSPGPDHLLETAAATFIVGDLLVDVGQQRVTRAGSDIGLPNLSFQLLVALVRAAPNVLSNESLMTQVWPGLVVSPETVSKRVNLLREALGDDPREPRYITGVRSRGYRLIASVSRATEGALLPNLPTPIPEGSAHVSELRVPPIPVGVHPADSPTSRPRLQRWAALSLLAAGALVAATIGVRWAARHQIEGAIPAPAAPATTTAAFGTLSRTVAVLPFDSISADPADAYLALGLPDMILNRLSRIDGLSVIARTSSFALATKSIDSREIGRRLNSGYLIGGSVQREADRLRRFHRDRRNRLHSQPRITFQNLLDKRGSFACSPSPCAVPDPVAQWPAICCLRSRNWPRDADEFRL